jgi:AsmA family protein
MRIAGAAALLLLIATAGAFAWGEAAGWPWLAAPLERALSKTLQRQVRLTGPSPATEVAPLQAMKASKAASASAPSSTAETAAAAGFRLRLLGGLVLETPRLDIAAPPWSQAPYFLQAGDVQLELRYIDLWRAHRGQPLRVELLRARSLAGHVERLPDGRASWLFGPDGSRGPSLWVPRFQQLRVDEGALDYRDLQLGAALKARFSMADGAMYAAAPSAPVSSSASAPGGVGGMTGENAVAAPTSAFKLSAISKLRPGPSTTTRPWPCPSRSTPRWAGPAWCSKAPSPTCRT